MKNRTLFTLLLMCVFGLGWAQNTDGGATELMRTVSSKYQAYSAMKFHYTLKVTKDSKTLSSSQGDFALKGSKYRASYSGQEFFCDGAEGMEWFEYWKGQRVAFYRNKLGFTDDDYRIYVHEKLAHYAKAADRKSVV